MQRLYVLYDARCEVCRRCRIWLGRQEAYVPLSFVPLQSADLADRFPGVERLDPDKELVVISDQGETWQGAAAWVTCLWALRRFRPWAQRLAHPGLLPFAQSACALLSEHRRDVSRWLEQSPAEELQAELSAAGAAGRCRQRAGDCS